MTGFSRSIHHAAAISMIALAGSLLHTAPALAADADNDAGADIVVTARKSSEDILKTPVTVTAITSDVLDVKGITNMTDVAASTPGININNNSSGHADRSFQQVILRGFTPSTTLATTTSMFIDGVPVSSPSAVTAVSSPERIEILKGPQSAYFGRNTFAGAINVVNKVPTGDWAGSLSGMVGTRDNWRLSGSVEGPIFGDVLTFRVTGDKFSKGGSYKNYDGSTQGDQSSTVGTALLVFKPTESLTIKAFGMMGEDKDGPSAQTRLYAYDVKDAAGNIVVASQSNCTLTGDTRGVLNPATGLPLGTAVQNKFFCGTLPKTANPITANVANNDIVRQFLALGTNRIVDPKDTVDGYGLLRKTKHAHITADYELNESLTASFLAGMNREVWSTLIDLDGYDGRKLTSAVNPKGYWDFPYLIERKLSDWSMEGRLAYESDNIHAVIGASHLVANQTSGGGGGVAALSPAVLIPGGKSRNKTDGVFFGLTYDVSDTLSASLEGRYQIDKLYAFARPQGYNITTNAFIPVGTYAGGSLVAKSTYKNFSPRIIVNWQASPDMMVYASWAKGVNPAQFNTTILAQNATVQNLAKANGGQLAIDPEKITNFEAGIKGRAFGGALRYTVAAYYAKWKDQINAVAIIAPDPSQPTGYTFISTSANAGAADLYGIEGDISWKVNDFLTIDAAGAINETDIQHYQSTAVSQLTGVYDYSGKEMKNTSKYSANVGVTIGTDIAAWEDGKWFLRGDWNFKSGVWTNEANITRSPDLHMFNVRAGISKGNVSLDVFVNNLFNNTTPTTALDNFTLEPTFASSARFSAVVLGLPDKRTMGVQAKIKF